MNITHCSNISSKGQIVIPAELRAALHLTPGTRITLQREGQTLVLRPITDEFVDSLIGSTSDAGLEREKSHREDER